MSSITDVWHQLVRRRLWPLAVLLLGALVAVPMLLAKSPEPPPAPPAAPQADSVKASERVTAAPVVTLADAGSARRRHVLGASKDPFEPAPTPEPKQPKPTPTPSEPAGGSGGGSTAPSGGSSAPTVSAPSVPAPSTPAEPQPPEHKPKTFPANSLTVRFGTDADSLERMTLEKLEPLPDDETPSLVYLGTAKDGRVARFLVDAGVQAQGDGRCESESTTDCGTLRMSVGDTEFLDVVDETGNVVSQFELDLVAIHAAKKAGGHTARAGRAKAAGRNVAQAASALAGSASLGGAALGVAGVARLLQGL